MTDPTDHDAADDTATTVQRWAYGGVRVLRGKRTHAFIAEHGTGDSRLYAVKASKLVIGEIYRVTVSQQGEHTVMHGEPRFAGDGRAEASLVAEWRARDLAARATLALEAQHRRAARRDELDEALAPLRVIAGRMRTRADRTALAAYILTAITDVWASGPRPSIPDT